MKRLVGILTVLLGICYTVLSIVARNKKGDYVYDNQPEEKNQNVNSIVQKKQAKNNCYDNTVKKLLDKVLSFLGLIVLFPVYAIISIAIYIDDPGTIVFTQKRVGLHKQYFKLHKFRTMKMSTPHDVPTHLLENPEQYITKVGKFLRKYSLDELPQLWDIFIGNMSIVGPRPALWNQDDLVAERDKYGANDVRPGLTGWAQINGRDELDIDVKAKFDGEYVEKESLWFDIKCILKTVTSVLKHEGVVEGGTGEMNKKEQSE